MHGVEPPTSPSDIPSSGVNIANLSESLNSIEEHIFTPSTDTSGAGNEHVGPRGSAAHPPAALSIPPSSSKKKKNENQSSQQQHNNPTTSAAIPPPSSVNEAHSSMPLPPLSPSPTPLPQGEEGDSSDISSQQDFHHQQQPQQSSGRDPRLQRREEIGHLLRQVDKPPGDPKNMKSYTSHKAVL